MSAAASAVAALASDAPDAESVVDFYLHWSGAPPDGDGMAAELGAALDVADLPPTVRRVTIAVGGSAGAPVRHFTFRPAEGRFHEERVTRDLHPMIARLLHLWRLANFDVTRLPAVEDVHLFHCAARENPSDERLVALAEVRDVTPVRVASGRLTALPELERVLTASSTASAACRPSVRAAGGCTETACSSTCGRR